MSRRLRQNLSDPALRTVLAADNGAEESSSQSSRRRGVFDRLSTVQTASSKARRPGQSAEKPLPFTSSGASTPSMSSAANCASRRSGAQGAHGGCGRKFVVASVGATPIPLRGGGLGAAVASSAVGSSQVNGLAASLPASPAPRALNFSFTSVPSTAAKQANSLDVYSVATPTGAESELAFSDVADPMEVALMDARDRLADLEEVQRRLFNTSLGALGQAVGYDQISLDLARLELGQSQSCSSPSLSSVYEVAPLEDENRRLREAVAHMRRRNEELTAKRAVAEVKSIALESENQKAAEALSSRGDISEFLPPRVPATAKQNDIAKARQQLLATNEEVGRRLNDIIARRQSLKVLLGRGLLDRNASGDQK